MAIPSNAVHVWLHAHWVLLQLSAVSRRRTAALAALGEDAARALPDTEAAKAATDALDALSGAVEASWREDREDYAAATDWGRWRVVLRGLSVRWVLEAKKKKVRDDARPLFVALGEASLESAGDEAARSLQHRYLALTADRDACLARFSGHLYPPPLRVAGRELASLFKAIFQETRSRTIPRLPALTGLLVGYGVTRTFTTSRWSGFLNDLGLYRGSQRVVSDETFERLQFWLPLIAAAVCSYLGSRIVAAVRARYAAEDAPHSGEERTVIEPAIRRR